MSKDFLTLAAKGVQGLQPYQPGKPIEELERELGISNIVKLASNENPMGPSEKVVAAITNAVADISRYPDGSAFALKEKLSQLHGVTSDQITIGSGSSEVLELTARIFLGAGESAIVSQHAFVVYRLYIQSLAAKAIVVPASDWGHDLEAMADAIDDKVRIIFIANPNNPTGTHVTFSAIEAFLSRVPTNVIVLLDEAYFEYVSLAEYATGVPLISKYPNLVVTRTFSKAYGLAALRIGYSISHPDIADLLNRLRPPFNVTTPALDGALAALEDQPYLVESRRVNSEGMHQLTTGLEALGLKYIPSVGNFITFELPEGSMGMYEALLRKGVIVRPIGVYEMPNHLRVSIGLPEENEKFLTALKVLLAKD